MDPLPVSDDAPTVMSCLPIEFADEAGNPYPGPHTWEWNTEVAVDLPEAFLGGRAVKGLKVVARDLVAFDAAGDNVVGLRPVPGTITVDEATKGVAHRCAADGRVTFRCPDDRTQVTVEAVAWASGAGPRLAGVCRLVAYGRLDAGGNPPPGVTVTALTGAPTPAELAVLLAGGLP